MLKLLEDNLKSSIRQEYNHGKYAHDQGIIEMVILMVSHMCSKLMEKQMSYTDFKVLLPEISDRTLSRQLNELLEDGLIEKEKDKTSSIYFITDKGRGLEPILKLLADYSED